MYSVADYGGMIADRVRMDAFVSALRQTLRPGSVAVDLGTGTGIFALLACQLGARRVYAIEPDDAIQVAREIAAANGYGERIEFIQELSTRVTLPERADVIISDLGGLLPWFKYHIPSIVDARTRFLRPGGVLIPKRDALWMAVVEAPGLYKRHSTPWTDNPYSLDMEAARRIATNAWGRGRVKLEHLLVEPRRLATLDYATVECVDISADTTWTVNRAGTAHGLGAGFDRTVIDGLCLSNAPDAPAHLNAPTYQTAFFPWSEPVALSAGDTVTVTIRGTLVGEDYVWCWDAHVLEQGHPGQVKASFKQSSIFSKPLSPAHVRKRAASYTPTLNEDGQVARHILDSMATGTSLGDIASQVLAQFPSRFRSWHDALAYVGDLSRQYG